MRCNFCLGSHQIPIAANYSRKGKRSRMLKEGLLWTLPQFILLFKHLLIAVAKGRSWGWRDD